MDCCVRQHDLEGLPLAGLFRQTNPKAYAAAAAIIDGRTADPQLAAATRSLRPPKNLGLVSQYAKPLLIAGRLPVWTSSWRSIASPHHRFSFATAKLKPVRLHKN